MTNNDVLRRLRYTFDYSDDKMIEIFASAGYEATREQVCNWLKHEHIEDYKNLTDHHLAYFLNGFINDKRGKKEGEPAVAEKKMTNNIILRKIKIALNLTSDEVIELLDLADLRISKHELTSFFRREDHKNFRKCRDQFIRNLLHGIQIKYRPDSPDSNEASKSLDPVKKSEHKSDSE